MSLVVALLLAAQPLSCEQLWPAVSRALDAQDLKGKEPFPTLPDGKARLGRAWVGECLRFSPETLACARGEQLEAQAALLRQMLEKERVPRQEIERAVARLRAEWNIFDCKDVDRAVDRAARAVAADAGLGS